MYDPLGLSIGTTNLVVTRKGAPPLSRRAVLTVFSDRPPELGLPVENPDRTEPLNPDMVISGFVERIGSTAERVSGGAAGGAKHDANVLLVDALEAMISAAGVDAIWSQLAIAVPAHWEKTARQGFEDALETHAGFGRRGIAPLLVSDAVAALAALSADVGLPNRGVVGLLDFGGGGTSITLADAGLGFEPITETVRYPEFSGDQIDRALRRHVLDDIGHPDDLDSGCDSGFDVLGPLTEECRQAKERLSAHPVTALLAELPGRCCGVRLTRDELERLFEGRLSGVISAFDDMLARNKTARTNLAAVATVGGGAAIPLVAQRLLAYTHLPVVTALQPAFAMARGAALLASRGSVLDILTPTAMVLSTAGANSGFAGLSVDDPPAGADAKTLHDLAWSEDEDTSGDLTRYAGRFYSDVVAAPPPYVPEIESPDRRPQRRYGLPQLFIGLSALVAMVAIGGVAHDLTTQTTRTVRPSPPQTSAPARPPSQVAPSAVAPPSSAVSSRGVEPAPSVESTPSSPSPAPPPPPPPVTTTYEPPVTTTYQPPSTNTTTTQPSTTMTTTPTTSPPIATATTTPPAEATTSTQVPMTTQWLKLPLIPVPIPVPVPQHHGG